MELTETRALSEPASPILKDGKAATSGPVVALMALYLAVRLIGVSGIRLLSSGDASAGVGQIVEVVMYILIAAMLWAGRGSLLECNIDRASVITFILFGTVLRTPTLPGLSPAMVVEYGALGLAAITLTVLFRKTGTLPKGTPGPTVNLIFMGVVVGVPMAFLAAIPFALGGGMAEVSSKSFATITGTICVFSIHAMGHSAILEEPVFRGFLMAALRRFQLSDRRIVVGQAVLFWLAHVYLVTSPFSFWIVTPIAGLVFGFLALKARSILPSLFAHATFNALSVVF